MDEQLGPDDVNLDRHVVDGFGEEWSRFTNESLSDEELAEMFGHYTANFPWDALPTDAVGFDAGCGSGRWARFFAPRVGQLHCVDASPAALEVARRALSGAGNVSFHCADLTSIPLPDQSCDFGYSLGVIHHIPDSGSATRGCVAKLKPGAPFLVYLYYSLEDASWLKRGLLGGVTAARRGISRLPPRSRHLVTDIIAATVYFPLARSARLLERRGGDPSRLPLFQYRNRSFYVMRNDALDRFGTRLEKRYTKAQVVELLEGAGLTRIEISDDPPWWVAVGWKPSAVT